MRPAYRQAGIWYLELRCKYQIPSAAADKLLSLGMTFIVFNMKIANLNSIQHSEISTQHYFNTPNSFPTLVNAAIALSKWCVSCPALTCTRMRARPFGTTGKKNPIT